MYWNTITPLLAEVLHGAMANAIFDPFRLVGGTSLSLQIGHRMSDDIDLFSDASYDSLDFGPINTYFQSTYPIVSTNQVGAIGFGTSYFVGHQEENQVKVDLYYTDPFIEPINEEEGIRLCSLEDIIGMKLDLTTRTVRKKDFWDLHALHDLYSIPNMIELYLKRYPYHDSKEVVLVALSKAAAADGDPDPICLLGKQWELIKLDFANWLDTE